jgi:hypothetical protein
VHPCTVLYVVNIIHILPSTQTPIPELTPSTATSEESHSNGQPYTPLGAGAPPNPFYSHNNGAPAPSKYPNSISSSKNQKSARPSAEHQSDITPSPSPLPVPFPTMAPFTSASSNSKESSANQFRRKIKRSGTGYESDGNASDEVKSKKEWEKMRREIEAKATKDAEKDAKAAAKEAKKEDKMKKSKSKREKKDKDKSKSPISGDVTEYETDGGSDGAYLSEAASFSSVKKTKASSKSKSDTGSDAGKPKKSGSFFRRKSKPTPVVPPMPVTPFLLSVSASSMPLSSGSGSGSSSKPDAAATSTVALPPIAAKFATTSATPPPPMPTPSPPVPSVSPNSPPSSPPPRANLSARPKTSPPTTYVSRTMPDADAAAYEGDDAHSTTNSSRSSEISMPTSLPTSTSTSSLRKPSRQGLFKFGGSSENIKVKPSISLPLTRPLGPGPPMSSGGVSPMPETKSSGLEPQRGGTPALEVRTQDLAKSAIARELSPASPAASFVMAPPMSSATYLPSPLAQSSIDRAPSPAPAANTKSSRPGMLNIQHPHEYNGSYTQDLLPPRRPSHAPVPPPTPPPTGPLPSVPPLKIKEKQGGMRAPLSAPPYLDPPVLPATARAPSPLQRGKEAPFPTAKREAGLTRLDGFEARMDVPRYRGLYGFGGGLGGDGNNSDATMGRQQQHVSAFSADSDEEEDEEAGYLDPEMLTNEFRQIRQRFHDYDRGRASVPVTEPDRYTDSLASGGDDSVSYQQFNSLSFYTAEPGGEQYGDETGRKYSDDQSTYPDNDRSVGRYDVEGRDSIDTRFSRISAAQSVYSVMDDKKSGEARERFLNRVAAMYGEGGREVPPVPPVPKLPEGIVIKGTGVGMRRRMGVHE